MPLLKSTSGAVQCDAEGDHPLHHCSSSFHALDRQCRVKPQVNPTLSPRSRSVTLLSFLFILGYISLVRTPLMFKSREHNASTDTLKSPNPHVSSTFKKSKKNPSTLGMLLDMLTQRTIIRVICSSWFTPRVQSKITKKYLASLMRSTTLLLTNIFI